MRDCGRLLWLFVGLSLGIAGTMCFTSASRPALAGNEDRKSVV